MTKPLSYKTLHDAATIAKRVQELGSAISKDLKGEPVIVLGVLKGAFVFMADLIRAINVPLTCEFIGVSSYVGTQSTGNVRITHDLSVDITGKNVLLVEDVIDTGKTIDYLIDVLKASHPKSIRVCTFLDKPEAHVMRHKIDYVGFNISKEFVIGYGLDLDERYRELPYLAQVNT